MKNQAVTLDIDYSRMRKIKPLSNYFNRKVTLDLNKLKMTSPDIWCVGGGKGGIGKSFISSSMGVLLSKRSKRVLLVDADFGAANLHTFIECRQRLRSFSMFLKRKGSNIRDVICKTAVEQVDLISGANDVLDVADMKENTVKRLVSELRMLDYDYILIDIGPGTSSNMLDLFLLSDRAILIATPEPTSIENTYRFLKALCLRRISQLIKAGENDELRRALRVVLGMTGSSKARTLMEIFERLKRLDKGRGKYLQAVIGNMDFSLMINQTKNVADENMGLQMKQACFDYFNIKIRYLGHVSYSEKVRASICSRKPLVQDFYQSKPALLIEACLKNMIGK